jgi:hypothetical protein
MALSSTLLTLMTLAPRTALRPKTAAFAANGVIDRV